MSFAEPIVKQGKQGRVVDTVELARRRFHIEGELFGSGEQRSWAGLYAFRIGKIGRSRRLFRVSEARPI
jgi:hypothetical protein